MKLRGRVVLVAALAAICLSAAATPASGRIVLQQGLAGIRLQMTPDQVKHVLGKPKGVKPGHNTYGRYFQYRYPKLLVVFQGMKTVTAIMTSRKTERTPHGIGVGSTKAQVKRIAGMHCRSALLSDFCYIGVAAPGRRITEFRFNGTKRVKQVEIGVVPSRG
jgi:hypothetical protein